MTQNDIDRLLAKNAPAIYANVMALREKRNKQSVPLVDPPKIEEDEFIKGLEEDQKKFDNNWIEV